MQVDELRKHYHRQIYEQVVRISTSRSGITYPNFADGSNRSSREIAWGIYRQLETIAQHDVLTGQTTGSRFETITKDFIESVFFQLQHLRPGKWLYSTSLPISGFDQYAHLAYLDQLKKTTDDPLLASALGEDYIVTPDIVVGRYPVEDEEINQLHSLLSSDTMAGLTSLRAKNHPSGNHIILHASISCKWTVRSDRAQNARTEALNLIRNRKGRLPHVMVVTGEPLPTRIAALALGTGDIDCVYHFALHELREAINDINNQDQLDMLEMMITGKRLRDISDLPFDLAT